AQQHHAGIRRCVIRVTCPGNELVDRAHAYDLACGAGNLGKDAAIEEMPNRFPSAQELTRQIYTDYGIPLGKRHFMECGVALEPSIVDEDVNPPEFLERASEHLLDLLFLRDVRLVRVRVCSGSTDLVDHRIRAILAGHVIYHHVGASLTQCDCGALTDSRIGTGDDSLLADENFRD